MKKRILGGFIAGGLCLLMLSTVAFLLPCSSVTFNASASAIPGEATVSIESSSNEVPESTKSIFAVSVKVESGSLIGGMDGWLSYDSGLFEYVGKKSGLANIIEPVVGSGNSIYISYLDINGTLEDLSFDLAVLNFKLRSAAVKDDSGQFSYTSNECNASNASDVAVTTQPTTVTVIEETLELNIEEEDELDITDFGGLRYLKNIAPDESLEKVLNKFSNKDRIRVLDAENITVADIQSAHAATGMKFRLMASDEETVRDELILIVVGDITGKGTVSMEDVLLSNNHRLEKANPSSDPEITSARTLSDIRLMAADVNGNGSITTAEVIQINNYRLFKTGNPMFSDRDSFSHLRLA